MAHVSASLIGLGLFGYIGVPYYARKAADYMGKLQLAQAWPFNSKSSDNNNNSDWVRVEGQVLKTDVIQLEEQCYAPRIIYSYKTDSGSNDVHVNDAIGIKHYDFSKIKTRTQDALPFHFLSRGTSVKFVSSLINNNNKVITILRIYLIIILIIYLYGNASPPNKLTDIINDIFYQHSTTLFMSLIY